MSLPRTGRSLHQRFRSFLSIRIESICFGVPNFDPYRNQENQSLRMSSKNVNCEFTIIYCMSLLCCRLGELAKGHCLQSMHAPRLRFTTDMTLARVMLPSDLGAKRPREGDRISQKGSTTDRWLAKLQKIRSHE